MRARRGVSCSLGVLALVLVAACSPAAPPPPVAPAPPSAPIPAPLPSCRTTPAAPLPAPLPSSAPDTPVEHALAQLLADAWEDRLREDPVFASTLGDRRYNDRWPEPSEANYARHDAHVAAFLARVRAIPRDQLSPPSQLDWDLFEAACARDVEGHAFGFDAFAANFHYTPVTPQGGVQSAGDLASKLRFETLQDYEDWIRRMETFPAYVDQTIAVMREGVKRQILYPRVVMQRVGPQIDRQLALPLDQNPFYRPFTHIPASFSEDDRVRLVVSAKRALGTRVVPAFQQLKTFLTKEYLPACFDPGIGVGQMPRGDEVYAYLARFHTTTTLSVQEIHDLGMREVTRLRGEMQKQMDAVGFKGTLKDFFLKLRTDPRFFYKTPDDLMEAYRATAKRIDPLLVKLVKTLPRAPYGVEPVPAAVAPDTTTAYYYEGAPDGSRAGTYFVNLYKPEARPIWEMMALTMHESVPGHHLQIALEQEMKDVPAFRREAGYTAFVEGWGLYAESLGDEVGLYADPYAKFGQLAYEMWRAIRLVVDTGMHAMKWDRQRAIEFFLENDPKASLDVTNEIDRYLVMPGQALAYEIGALKIKELRARAKSELGARFDVREFHDAVLEQGAVPLDVLERHIDAWIEKKKSAAP